MATTALGDRTLGGRRRAASPALWRARCSAAWRRNARRLSLPDALADRLLRADARADDRLALSLLHRLRPADARRAGPGSRTTNTRSSRTSGSATRCRSPSTTSLWSVPLKLAVALALAMALDRGVRGVGRLPRDLLPAVAARRVGRDRHAVAADFRRRRPGQPAPLPDARHHRAGLGHASRTTRCGRWSCWRSGSSARR